MFGFEVHGVQPGGAAEVKLFLPEGFNTNTYYKQDSAGTLQRFDFDGTTGAVFNGNVVTLHLVDGGRGDADGIANGSILDPGGPGDPLPYVRLAALDPTAAKYRVDAVHGTSTGAFVVYRGGDLSEALTVNYTVNSSSTAVAGQDYQALTGTAVIQPGQATAGIVIRPLDNAGANSTKTVGISLSESPDYVVGTTGTPVVTISETSNDYPLPYMPMGQPGVGVLTLDANAGELPNESSTGLDLVFRSAVVTEMVPGGGMTWTNPAAVTAFYSVSQTGTASGDYQSLSGSASLPYAVFASEVKITPIDDPTLEGPEDVTISLTQNASYAVVPPGTGTVTIQDDEEIPVAPQANPDEYVMGASESSLSVEVGVLHNDYVFSPGTVTAVLMQDPSSGSVLLNADGSFVYTPGAAIKATGGDDTFYYVAQQDNRRSGWTPVGIHVVKITITTPGLDHSANMTTGAFVPINANNNNGSAVESEIPGMRDFDAGPWNTEAFDDPDLIEVDVVVNPNVGVPGSFRILYTDWGEGNINRIKLWRQQNKLNDVNQARPRAEGVYTLANLPRTFYMEGTEPSLGLRDGEIYVNYLGLGGAGDRDRLATTVTPVITNFSITAGPVVFANGVDGTNGLRAGTIGAGAVPGASFDATVLKTGVSGSVTLIQNMVVAENGLYGGAGACLVYGAGLGPNKKLVLTRGAFPILDRGAESTPPLPDYDEDVAYPDTGNVNTQRITANDSPAIFNPVADRAIQGIDLLYSFKLYLVWRFGDPRTGILYTLAISLWQVEFRGTTSAGGPGWVDTISSPSGVYPYLFERKHDDPKVVGPIFNTSWAIVNV